MDREQHVVKRPNETIGIVPNGKQRITHLVRRLYSVILLFSQQQGEKEEYAAFLSEMLEAANSSGSNRTQVKAILRDIRAIGVDWNVRDGDREIWKNVGLIEEPGLIDGKGTPTIVTWKLPKIIRARLLDPRGFFTRISLEMMTRLRSGASIALYEICCQYVSNDHGKGEGGLTNRAPIADWMPRLTGSRTADYEYKFLKRDVLLTAIEEINEITDLRVELVEHKLGRRVGELQFRVFRKQVVDSTQVAMPTATPVTTPVTRRAPTGQVSAAASVESGPPSNLAALTPEVQRMLAIGAPLASAERLARRYAPDVAYLLRHLDYVEARIRSTGTAPLVNKLAFLQKALEHGYADAAALPVMPAVPAVPVVAAALVRVGSKTGSPAKALVKAVALPKDIALQQRELTLRAEVWKQFQELGDATSKAKLVAEFLGQTGATLKTFYKKNGVNNMIVKASLTDWLIEHKKF